MAIRTTEKEGIEIEQTWADLPKTRPHNTPYYSLI